uniref:Ribosome biogenesis protein NOP53 n=1 Tax=Fagus sylvatica TaxID=28930 RepID=A0A2N9J7D1_FAGSY
MGKRAKTSRKGKKAWRANISSKDIEDFYEKSTKDALSGGSLSSAPSDSLFFVDKSTDLSVKRKIEKHREKVLRCDSVLQKNPFVQLVPSSTRKKSKRKLKEVPKADDATQVGSKDESATASAMVGLWDEKGEDNSKPKKKLKHSAIPAVEVEPPGCSFNPSVESHQDVLAHAVAEEMQKVYQNELGPKPVPLTVPGEAIDEEDMYFIEADGGSDDDNETNLENENEGIVQEKSSSKTKRVTRVELNKRARRKEHLKKEAEARKMEEVSKEIDSIPDIIQEIAKEDEEKQKRHLRRVVAKQERLKSCPPRLGKFKFEPAPVQVLLSEELTGSLRKLKACCTLAKDRYKSLEKRGLIIPTVKSRRQQCPVVGEGDHCSFLKMVIFKLK